MRGLPFAQLNWGTFLVRGDHGLTRNEELGWKWIEAAAKGGNAEAQALLARRPSPAPR